MYVVDITNLGHRKITVLEQMYQQETVVSMNRGVRNVAYHSFMLLVVDNINYYLTTALAGN